MADMPNFFNVWGLSENHRLQIFYLMGEDYSRGNYLNIFLVRKEEFETRGILIL